MSEKNQGITRRGFLSAAAATGALAAFGLSSCAPSGETSNNTADDDVVDAGVKQAEETLDVDVVVVGSGAAGSMAAYEAAKGGAGKVLVVTKSGSATDSNWSVVSGTAAVETPDTEEIGQEYSLDDLYQRMIKFAHWTVNPRLLKNCVELLPSNVELLRDMGVESMLVGDRYNIGIMEVHIFLTPDKGAVVNEALEGMGVEFMYDTAATHVLIKEGKAVGIQAEDGRGKVINVNAKAVCVGTGGYMANEEKVKEHYGNIPIVNMGSRHCRGDGERMVLKAGGFAERVRGLGMNDIYGMNHKASVISVFDANPLMQLAFYGNLLVNQHGERFMNEYMLAQEPMGGGGEATLHAARYYAIYSEKTLMSMKEKSYFESIGSPEIWTSAQTMFSEPIPDFDKNLEAALDEGWCYKDDTVEALGKTVGLPGLAEAVKEYDAMVAAGRDTLFDKVSAFMQPVEDGSDSYYIFEYNPSAFNTFGGARTDENCCALTSGFEEIPGLYVVGVENGSLFSSPYYDVGGTCNGLSLSSGRVAGKNIVEYIKA